MPGSQLKRLKASLRESGVTGPQKSKKQKVRESKDGKGRERAISRASALDDIREKLNPFEVKLNSRGPKHVFATTAKAKSNVLGRPGVSRTAGEDLRRRNLLTEMKQRNKVGGIMDRRFGENDPTMTPEQRAHERFVREQQRGRKKSSMFDLEADDDEMDQDGGLTHLGRPLSLSGQHPRDDYEDSDRTQSDDNADEQAIKRASKKRRLLEEPDEMAEREMDEAPSGRPKTKQEVMKEVIAKSKLHKYERQKAKEEDEDLREELDASLGDIFAQLSGKSLAPALNNDKINADRAALIQGKTREQADKEYDQQLKAMALEARGKPSTRTKTEEEIAEEEAERLQKLEKERLRRMRGEESSDSEVEQLRQDERQPEQMNDSEDEFGLGPGIPTQAKPALDVEDEDEFELDHDLIASGSELEMSSDDDPTSDLSESENEFHEADGLTDDEAEFVKDLLSKEDEGREDLKRQSNDEPNGSRKDLAFTFPCPQSHKEFVQLTSDIKGMDLITVVQRIRALHSPKLDPKNKQKLAVFAQILVDHIAFYSIQPGPIAFDVLEQIIRHVHSLAKAYPIDVANAFRKLLIEASETRPTKLNAGDLMLFNAIAETFPTSDHFHQVVTPAMICMAWYLGQSIPKTLGDLAKGAYVCTQFLQYQALSKRYIPEVVSYTMIALENLAPKASKKPFGQTPRRDFEGNFRIKGTYSGPPRKMEFNDIFFASSFDEPQGLELKHALIVTFAALASHMAELWLGTAAYIEIVEPLANVLAFYLTRNNVASLSDESAKQIRAIHTKLTRLLAQARIDRKPLRLHNHRPLPIKTAIPKFEENFNPDKKSYDPDQDRVESAKLRAEHKKERKGALRELRKDASFIARENLRQKKEADAEYEKKYKRLVAEIQGEEAREGNAYEREKRFRQGKK